MKNKLIYFLRRRRQSDAIKLACIFVLAGMGCLISAAYYMWEIYQSVNTPAEYVLTGEERISEKRMDQMRQNEAVAKMSRQMECPVSVVCGGREASITCTLISREYLEEMFQTDLTAGTKKIYINETAFSELREQIQGDHQKAADLEGGDRELDIRYLSEGEFEEEENETVKYRSAKLIVVENQGEEEEGAAYMAETDNRLLKDANSLRVQFAKHDLDGLQIGSLRKLGYVIQNEETVISEEYELQIKQLHIQYSLLSCALCAAAVFAIRIKMK